MLVDLFGSIVIIVIILIYVMRQFNGRSVYRSLFNLFKKFQIYRKNKNYNYSKQTNSVIRKNKQNYSKITHFEENFERIFKRINKLGIKDLNLKDFGKMDYYHYYNDNVNKK
jgi:hypothetical protein